MTSSSKSSPSDMRASGMRGYQRFDLDEEYRVVAARAIRLRHPHAKRLVTLRPEDMPDDENLIEVVLRLTRWCDEQES